MAEAPTRLEPRTESELAGAALRFARRAHLGQHRKQTHEQFVEHPIAVARLLVEAGYDDEVIVAAYLHDVVEKTEIELPEIRERFGPEVAELIDSLSEDNGIPEYAERKRALRRRILEAGRTPILIYAADRVANMRDWRRVPPEDRRQIGARLHTTVEERFELWREDLEELTRLDPELPFLAEMELELRELTAEAPPAAA
jgi:GTP pyrophosphokinase